MENVIMNILCQQSLLPYMATVVIRTCKFYKPIVKIYYITIIIFSIYLYMINRCIYVIICDITKIQIKQRF